MPQQQVLSGFKETCLYCILFHDSLFGFYRIFIDLQEQEFKV